MKLSQNQIIEILKPWEAHKQALDAAFKPLKQYLSAENPLHESMWLLFDSYTDAIALQVGDDGEWLDWYCYENAMGARGHEAKHGGHIDMREIRNLGDLAWLIGRGE